MGFNSQKDGAELNLPFQTFCKTASQLKKKTKATYVFCSDGSGKDNRVIVFKVVAAQRTGNNKEEISVSVLCFDLRHGVVELS